MNTRNLIFYCLLSVFLFLNIACSQKSDLTVISHNVLAFAGHPDSVWVTNNEMVIKAAELYESHNPDIIILQEAPEEPVIEMLAELLNFNYVYFSPGSAGSTQYPYGFPGAILSHYKIHDPEDFIKKFPEKPETVFTRHLGSAKVETPQGPIFILATHLCSNFGGVFREETRMAEVSYIKENVQFCDQCRLNIWAADFNFKPVSNPYNEIIDMGFQDTDSPTNVNATVPVPDGKAKIDHIFYLGEIDTVTFEVIQMPFYDDLQKYLSDHHAVKATFHF